jgi:hypothetical protein
MRLAALALALPLAVVLAPSTAAAESAFCGVEQAPLLEVLTYQRTFVLFRNAFIVEERNLFVFTQGTAVESAAQFAEAAGARPALPELATVARGKAAAASFAGLNRALGEARVGLQRDCALTRGGFGAHQAQYRLSWTGRAGRRNVFRVHSAHPELELCSPQVFELLNALEFFRASLLLQPATEVLAQSAVP